MSWHQALVFPGRDLTQSDSHRPVGSLGRGSLGTPDSAGRWDAAIRRLDHGVRMGTRR